MINDSRLRNGTLKLGPVGTGQIDASCQITNARVTTAYSDDGDSITVLCGDTVPAPRKLDGHKLEGTMVQDFDLYEAVGGVVDYLWNHNLEVVDFEFVPNDPTAGPTLTGTLQIEIPTDTYGGDVNTRLTTDFVWSMQGAPIRQYPGVLPPTITALAPTSVPAGVDTPVTITGTGFAPTSQVLVDDVVYPTGTYVSATEMTFSAMAESAGVQQITVKTGSLTSAPFTLDVT